MSDIGTPEHPSARLLAGYVDRRLSRVQQDEVEGHLSWCEDCRLLVSQTARMLAARRRRRYALAGIGTAGAAAAAAIAILVIGPAIEAERERPVLRAPAAESVETVIPVVRPTGQTSLSEGSLTFVWRPVGAKTRYRFSLSAPDGREIWGASVDDTVVTLPEDIEVEAGETYVWFVDALLPDGTAATTGLQRVTIER